MYTFWLAPPITPYIRTIPRLPPVVEQINSHGAASDHNIAQCGPRGPTWVASSQTTVKTVSSYVALWLPKRSSDRRQFIVRNGCTGVQVDRLAASMVWAYYLGYGTDDEELLLVFFGIQTFLTYIVWGILAQCLFRSSEGKEKLLDVIYLSVVLFQNVGYFTTLLQVTNVISGKIYDWLVQGLVEKLIQLHLDNNIPQRI